MITYFEIWRLQVMCTLVNLISWIFLHMITLTIDCPLITHCTCEASLLSVSFWLPNIKKDLSPVQSFTIKHVWADQVEAAMKPSDVIQHHMASNSASPPQYLDVDMWVECTVGGVWVEQCDICLQLRAKRLSSWHITYSHVSCLRVKTATFVNLEWIHTVTQNNMEDEDNRVLNK